MDYVFTWEVLCLVECIISLGINAHYLKFSKKSVSPFLITNTLTTMLYCYDNVQGLTIRIA